MQSTVSQDGKVVDEEISIKELMEKAKDFFRYLLKKWKTFIVFCLIGGGLGIYYAYNSKTEYTAELTFALQEKQGGGMSGFGSIAAAMGFDIGGNSGAFSGDNIIELLKSRRLIESTLLTPIEYNGKQDLLINRYIDVVLAPSAQSLKAKGIVYEMPVDRKKFTIVQDSFLYVVEQSFKAKRYLSIVKLDKKLSIISVKFRSIDEIFSKYFIEALVKNASQFYIDTKTKKSRNNVNLLQNRADSIQRLLDQQIYGAAMSKDQNQNVILARASASFAKSQINVQLLTAVYAELVKNLEISKMSLSQEEPLVQVIDVPIFPLDKNKPGKLSSAIIGAALSAIFLCLILALIYYRKNKTQGAINSQ